MRYRTKLLGAFVLSGVFVTSLTVTILMDQRWKLLLEQRRSKLRTLVATTAALIPGELLADVRKRQDETTPAYQRLEEMMQKVRIANQRGKRNFQIDHVYVLRKSATHPGQSEYVADAQKGAKAHVGAIYRKQGGHVMDIAELQCDEDFHTDPRGSWLSANAPITDSSGSVVGAACADLAKATVEENLGSDVRWGFLSMAVSLPLLTGCALLLAGWVTKPLHILKNAVHSIGKGQLATRIKVQSRDEFGDVAQAVNIMAAGLEERERVKTAFAHYMSQTLLEKVLQAGDLSLLKGDRRRITVLFSDIRDFTTLAEKRRPEEVVLLLNAYFERMIDVVFRHHGFVDKMMGDGLMVTFGVFEEDSRHEEQAVQTALEMQEEMQKLCAQWEKAGEPPLRIGIGIHTGEAIVGNIGSSHRVRLYRNGRYGQSGGASGIRYQNIECGHHYQRSHLRRCAQPLPDYPPGFSTGQRPQHRGRSLLCRRFPATIQSSLRRKQTSILPELLLLQRAGPGKRNQTQNFWLSTPSFTCAIIKYDDTSLPSHTSCSDRHCCHHCVQRARDCAACQRRQNSHQILGKMDGHRRRRHQSHRGRVQ